MKVLVVDDEELIRGVIKEYLVLEGFEVDEASNGEVAVKLVSYNDYALIIMDIMMPHMDGFKACREIKKIKDIPCIMLSARSEEDDKLNGFEIGIDDYVTKPFSPKELMARVKAVLKRIYPDDSLFKFGELIIDDKAHDVILHGEKLYLTPKEYDLLKYFVNNKNIALSREQLLTNVWGYDFFGDDRTIDTHVKTLRKNLGNYGDHIKTIRGIGYKFEYYDKK